MMKVAQHLLYHFFCLRCGLEKENQLLLKIVVFCSILLAKHTFFVVYFSLILMKNCNFIL